jgi:hypothetical protein
MKLQEQISRVTNKLELFFTLSLRGGDHVLWSEWRVDTPAIQARSSAGTASIHLDVYSQRREHFRVYIQKFSFHFFLFTLALRRFQKMLCLAKNDVGYVEITFSSSFYVQLVI